MKGQKSLHSKYIYLINIPIPPKKNTQTPCLPWSQLSFLVVKKVCENTTEAIFFPCGSSTPLP